MVGGAIGVGEAAGDVAVRVDVMRRCQRRGYRWLMTFFAKIAQR